MIMTRVKSKKVAHITFSIVTNKVLTRKSLFVIKTARQNVLTTFSLKNISEKLSLAASGSFFLLLASSFSSVKVPSKRYTQISSNIVSTISKSPKIFNNRPVNKLVFPTLTISTTTTTAITTATTTTTTTTTTITTASQMAVKAKNSKKQQQTVVTAMVIPNPFVIPDEIFAAAYLQDQLLAMLPNVVLPSRSLPIPVAKQSIISDNFKDWADQIKMESTISSPVSGAANGNA
ncbi:hypothetical protein G9A89_012788 [Geosiphon pyriformis]|nr:hypothetical protein G9A89_012788 [Geosiphon pyriformis]